MSHLVPCPSCKRHVRAASSTCPFCDVELGARRGPLPVAPRGVSRSAMLAFGAALAGSAAIGCSEDTTDSNAGATSGGGTAGSSAASTTGSSTSSASGATGSGGSGGGAGGQGGAGGAPGGAGGTGNIAPPYGSPPFE